MNLTLKPDLVEWAPMHYVFIEKIGPFSETARQAWQEFKAVENDLGLPLQGRMSLYQIEQQMIYRAGASLREKPANVPAGLSYQKFEGGKYYRFTLTGSYMQLPEACGLVFKAVKDLGLKVRPAFFIENYVNDPAKTPEAELKTEILIPTV